MYEVKEILRVESKIIGYVLSTTFIENRQAGEIPPFYHRIMEADSFTSMPNRLNNNQICLFDKKPDSPNFDYYMGVEVEADNEVPEGMKEFIIPEGRYAVTKFIKTGNIDVMQALKYVMDKWIPENNQKQNHSKPVFVCYDEKFIEIYRTIGYKGSPVAELYIPLV